MLLFKLAPKHSVTVRSSGPKGRKAAMSLIEQMDVLDKLHSGRSCSWGQS